MTTATDPSTRLPLDSHTLHIVEQGDLGWAVWLNCEDIDFSGLCVGTGRTRNDAVGAAVRTLEEAAEVLQRPPAGKVCWMCRGQQRKLDGAACSVCSGTGRLG